MKKIILLQVINSSSLVNCYLFIISHFFLINSSRFNPCLIIHRLLSLQIINHRFRHLRHLSLFIYLAWDSFVIWYYCLFWLIIFICSYLFLYFSITINHLTNHLNPQTFHHHHSPINCPLTYFHSNHLILNSKIS